MRKILVLLVAATSAPVFAHPGHDGMGFLANLAHSVTRLDARFALFVLCATALTAALLHRPAAWLLRTHRMQVAVRSATALIAVAGLAVALT